MKSIMFKTKIFHEVKMYLLVSDVTKMMEISEKAFCKKYSDKIVEIPGCRKCIAETDFNLLISDDKELFKKMGMLEVTKVETLRSEIASIIRSKRSMDEMRIVSKFTRGIISKAIKMVIRKKTGYNIDIQLNEAITTINDGKTHLHLDVDAELDKDELMSILKSIGLN